MSLNYGTLRTRILDDAHRNDGTISDDTVKGFVRDAEGRIARELRCAEMMTRESFTETDRVSNGIYSLPSGWLQEGIIWNPDGFPMDKVGLAAIRRYMTAMDVLLFCPLSSTEIEFRGVPGTNATFEQIYFKRPTALTGDSDVNDILTNHEAIYVQLGLEALYVHTQDLELAETAAGIATAAIETLNEQAGRLLAGAQAQGPYDLSSYGAR